MRRHLLELFSGLRGAIFLGGVLVVGALIFIFAQVRADRITPERLAYQKELARWDPILALPGISPEELDTEIAGLRTIAADLASHQKDARDATLVRDTLYPLRFLTALSKLERARLSFLDNGSRENYETYYAAENTAIRSYFSDLERFRRAFLAEIPADIGQYAIEKKIITRGNMLSAIDVFRNNAKNLETRIRARASCLSKNTSTCPLLIMPSFSSSESNGATRDELIWTQGVQNLLQRAGYAIETSQLILLADSICIAEHPGTALLFGFKNLPAIGDVASSSSPIYLGDIRFVDSTKYAFLPFFKYFTQKDVTFTPSEPLSHYACPESYQDAGTILAIQDIRNFAVTNRLSRYVSGEQGDSLKTLEREFQTSQIISEESSKRYLQGAIQNLDAFPVPAQNGIATLALEMRLKSRGTLQTIKNIQFYEKTNMLINDEGLDIDFGALYLFFTRSAFPSFFLSGGMYTATSVSPLFKPNDLPPEREPYLYYSGMKKTATLEEKLLHDMRIYHTTHDSAL